MSRDDVEVRATLLDSLDDEAPVELNHYDQESQACCGRDDFRQLLEAWKAFSTSSSGRQFSGLLSLTLAAHDIA